MRLFSHFGLLLLVSSLLVLSCNREKKPLVIPSTYDGSSFESNTSNQNYLINQLIALTDEAKKGRTATNTLSRNTMESLFTSGNPSLSGEITTYYKGRMEGTNGFFDELAKASGKSWTPQAPNGISEGGVFSGYLFDENGLEMEQLIEKGQFNATLYNHAIKLMSGLITASTVDQLLSIYGAKPGFVNSGSNNAPVDVRDRMMANYGSRRDKNDGNGLYSQMKKAFITLQAAVKAGEDYVEERDKAVKDIQVIWEKINAGTVVNYCHSAISILSGTNPSDAQKASALHALGEGIGFISGLKSINPTYRKITDAQIDEILTQFNVPESAKATVYKFATDPVNELPKIQQALTILQSIYGFSSQEMDDFKSNWVSIQNR